MDELNRKLAEWAGLPTDAYDNDLEWVAQWGLDFATSLDACFRWLVPKLWVCEMVMHEGIFFSWRVGAPEYGEPVNGGAFETPALALCKAIEKVIDAR